MKIIFIMLNLLLIVFGCTHKKSIQKIKFNFSGEKRLCLIELPDTKRAGGNPLLLILHGRDESASFIRYRSGNKGMFCDSCFITVYPNGKGFVRHRWNNFENEISFLNSLIDTLISTYNVDIKRIYITGFSQGGELAYRMACKNSDRIAAIALVASSIDSQYIKKNCTMNKPVSLMSFTSLADRACSFDSITYQGIWYNSVNTGLRAWADNIGCFNESETEFTSNGIRMKRWNNPEGYDVVQWITNKGGHAWPGGKGFMYIPHFEPFKKLNANQKMIEFFTEHSIR